MKAVGVGSREIHKCPEEIPISFSELGSSLFELPNSLKELGNSLSELGSSSRELGNSLGEILISPSGATCSLEGRVIASQALSTLLLCFRCVVSLCHCAFHFCHSEEEWAPDIVRAVGIYWVNPSITSVLLAELSVDSYCPDDVGRPFLLGMTEVEGAMTKATGEMTARECEMTK